MRMKRAAEEERRGITVGAGDDVVSKIQADMDSLFSLPVPKSVSPISMATATQETSSSSTPTEVVSAKGLSSCVVPPMQEVRSSEDGEIPEVVPGAQTPLSEQGSAANAVPYVPYLGVDIGMQTEDVPRVCKCQAKQLRGYEERRALGEGICPHGTRQPVVVYEMTVEAGVVRHTVKLRCTECPTPCMPPTMAQLVK